MNTYEWCVFRYLSARRIRFARVTDVVRVAGLTGGANTKNFDFLVQGPPTSSDGSAWPAESQEAIGAVDDETTRSALCEAMAASGFTSGGSGALLEVKGRQFPTSGGAVWENWTTSDDLDSLDHWARHFGDAYRPLIVFAYRRADPDAMPGRPWTPMRHRKDQYGLVAAELGEYRKHSRIRSRSWGTVSVPKAQFLKIIRPLAEMLPAGDETIPLDSTTHKPSPTVDG